MKVITWNINSVRIRLGLLERLILQLQPDVICLQETKVIDELFPKSFFHNYDYKYIICNGQKSYNGVAIISRLPIESDFTLNFYNDHARHIAASINNIEIHNFYVPAGGDEPSTLTNPKFLHKLSYLNLMKEWFLHNRNYEDNIILLGDLNIAPHENDVWSTKQLANVVSHTDVERKSLLDLQKIKDFVDIARMYVPYDQKLYSWWSYRNLDWQKSNRGRRLDHIWCSKNLEYSLKGCTTLSEVRAWPQSSDHVPIMVTIQGI
jgi:exodeoxyribonuclease-3